MQMRTGADRLRHTLGFEGLGLMISIPLFSLLTGQPADHLGPLAIGLSLLATGWNYLYNLLVDHWMVRQLGRLEKRFLERVLHALLFELGLLLVALPLTALFALVFKSNYWLVAAAIQAESLLKVPLCALRIRTGKWIHDVTLPQGEL